MIIPSFFPHSHSTSVFFAPCVSRCFSMILFFSGSNPLLSFDRLTVVVAILPWCSARGIERSTCVWQGNNGARKMKGKTCIAMFLKRLYHDPSSALVCLKRSLRVHWLAYIRRCQRHASLIIILSICYRTGVIVSPKLV